MADQGKTTPTAVGGNTVETERRYTSGDTGKAELRADGGAKKIGGYAAVFNRQSRNLGGFIEIVDPIAFNQSPGGGWPDGIARYKPHDNQLLGTTPAGPPRVGPDPFRPSLQGGPPASHGAV